LQHATQAIAAQLEERIRAYPHLWYQFYPYWRAVQTDSAVLGHAARPPHD
jgi:predicted LPLAT superfamily acyltransferase